MINDCSCCSGRIAGHTQCCTAGERQSWAPSWRRVNTHQQSECCRPGITEDLVDNKVDVSAVYLSAGLPGHPLHHVAALLPGDGVALLPGHRGALLLIHVVGPGHGFVLAHLVGHLLALLAGLLDVIAGLKRNRITFRQDEL